MIDAGGGAVVAIRLGEWWQKQLLHSWSESQRYIATPDPGPRITTVLGLPIIDAEDEYEIEPLDEVPE